MFHNNLGSLELRCEDREHLIMHGFYISRTNVNQIDVNEYEF
jgi:hypothetical protein